MKHLKLFTLVTSLFLLPLRLFAVPWGEKIVSSGFGDPNNTKITSIENWYLNNASYFFIGTGNAVSGTEIWRSSDTVTWTQINADGFGDRNNTETNSLAVCRRYDSVTQQYYTDLYAGTRNDVTGAEIWRSSDGVNWTQINADGFGNKNNTNIKFMKVSTGALLYICIENIQTGAELWRSRNGKDWEKVGLSGLGDVNNTKINTMAFFKTKLYLGTFNNVTGGELWSTTDGIIWTQESTDGLGDKNNLSIEVLAVLNNMLYAGTFNPVTGAELWRTEDGNLWTQVNPDGFGNKNNLQIITFAALNNPAPFSYIGWGVGSAGGGGSGSIPDHFNSGGENLGTSLGYLFVGTENNTDGLQIWRSSPTATPWIQVGENGFGNKSNYAVGIMYSNYSYLYIGTYNNYTGAELYKAQSFYIIGYVKDSQGNGVNGIPVTLTGPVSETFVSKFYYETKKYQPGVYGFGNLPPGTYTLSVSSPGWNFQPSLVNINISTYSLTQDFVDSSRTAECYYIKGFVTDTNGNKINNAKVILSGDSQWDYTTNETGYYEFISLVPGNYTVRALKETFSFTPPARQYKNLSQNLDNQSFIGYPVWTFETVDATIKEGRYTSIALDSNNNPHIVYGDYANKLLKYIQWSFSNGWITSNVDSYTDYYISLALDTSNNPYITYYKSFNFKLANWLDGNWKMVNVSLNSNYYSFKLDVSNYLHYSNGNMNKIYYYSGSQFFLNWIEEVVDTDVDYQSYTSIDLDNSGQPHISYSSNQNISSLKYAKRTSTGGWNVEIVDLGKGYISVNSINLDSQDTPRILYSHSYRLKYGQKNLSTGQWNTEVIENVSPERISSFIDKNDNLYIAYYNGYPNYCIKYAKLNATENVWNIEIIKSSVTSSSGYPSLAVDSNSIPYVSYFDSETGHLKLAKRTLAPPINLYSIKGYVKDNVGKSIPDVSVALTGTLGNLELTNNNGYYEFTGLISGTYTVTPKKEGYTFIPENLQFVYLTTNLENQNFTGYQNPTDIPVNVKVIGGTKSKGTVNPDIGETVKIEFTGNRIGQYECKIFTLTGDLVYEDSQVNVYSGRFEWIPQNIATGIYIVTVRGPGLNRREKVAIVR